MRKLTEPMVDPKIWDEVPNSHVGESVSSAQHNENRDGDSKTEVTEQNELSVLCLIQGA